MSELKHFGHIVLRAPRADTAILLITFLLTVFADLVVAVNIGVILAILQFLRRMQKPWWCRSWPPMISRPIWRRWACRRFRKA
jgi:hypothetical protein